MKESVFFGQHDRQDARRLRGIAWILAAEFESAIEVVNLPEDAQPFVVEGAEVVLTIRVVFRRKFRKRLYLLADR